ncbi:hypothetical protein [Nocardiopsis sp. NRRL B-16309]|uniref:hypothetical protein n=1 Tax=Nocardiopsis sp. NRRL B-16309 TaxID=1519494 RepID=UPI0006AFC2A5|nr:hypothetical protein [Nocardiopsis sp. NRRL B-16309]KOX10228.1 hypothetical protein ADL05_26570 [Nocardiopsis sp. NRRL B-16309]
MRHKQINAFLAVLVALLAAGIAIDEGTNPLLLAIFAAACGFTALVAADSYRKNRSKIRRRITRLTAPTVAGRRSRRKGARK